jgi:hypothetical protein
VQVIQTCCMLTSVFVRFSHSSGAVSSTAVGKVPETSSSHGFSLHWQHNLSSLLQT